MIIGNKECKKLAIFEKIHKTVQNNAALYNKIVRDLEVTRSQFLFKSQRKQTKKYSIVSFLFSRSYLYT